MASSPATGIRHEVVFITFRGLDTRRTFTCHLYKALLDKKISTYIDSNLDKGGEIAPALLKAIEEAKIYVIIFSKRYASSAWCLDELVHIMKCKERNDATHVIPIFYETNPATIRLQKDSYELEKNFKYMKIEKARRLSWRDALTKASNLSGFHSSSTTFRDDSDLIEQVVEDISKKLVGYAKPESSIDSVGFSESFNNQFAEVLSLLQFLPSDDRVRSAFADASLLFSSPFDAAFLSVIETIHNFPIKPVHLNHTDSGPSKTNKNHPDYVPIWYQSKGMDSRVEKLEAAVSSLTAGVSELAMDQKKIIDQLAEVVSQLRSRPFIEEGERSINNSRQNFDNRSDGNRHGGPYRSIRSSI